MNQMQDTVFSERGWKNGGRREQRLKARGEVRGWRGGKVERLTDLRDLRAL